MALSRKRRFEKVITNKQFVVYMLSDPKTLLPKYIG